MALIKVTGFAEIPDFISVVPNEVSAMGQLSSHGRTFSLDQDEFSDPNKDVANLIVFSSKILDVRQPVPEFFVNKFFDIMEKSYTDFKTNTDFDVQLKEFFGEDSEEVDKIFDISTGPEILFKGKQYPQWLMFSITETGGDTVEAQIWLSDTSFKAEYPLYDIKVIGPTTTVPELYSEYDNVKTSLSQLDLEKHLENVEIVRAEQPFTKQKIVELIWEDPNDSTKRLSVNFFCLVYGPAGENRDSLLDAVRQYLISNSTVTEEQWVVNFPELLNLDIIHFIPQWDRIVSLATQNGVEPLETVYSPVIPYDTAMDNARKVITDLTLSELKKITDIFPLSYKTLGVLAIGSNNNSEGKKRFSEAHPTYTLISVNVPDGNRVAENTLALINRLALLVRICEEDEGSDTLPSGYSRVSVNGTVFIEASQDGVVLRMITRKSYLSKIGG